MKSFLPLFIILMAIPCFAANSVISFTDQMTNNNTDYTKVQSEAANPLLTQLIADNLSHTLLLSSIQTSSAAPIIYLSLRFNGTGTGCIVRLMNTTTKASYVAYPVAAAAPFGQGIHPNFKYFNYSSCYN
jgi:hypothetical protein